MAVQVAIHSPPSLKTPFSMLIKSECVDLDRIRYRDSYLSSCPASSLLSLTLVFIRDLGSEIGLLPSV